MNSVKYLSVFRDLNFIKPDIINCSICRPIWPKTIGINNHRNYTKPKATFHFKTRDCNTSSHYHFYSTDSIKLKSETQSSEPGTFPSSPTPSSEPKLSRPVDPSEHPLNFFDTYSLSFDPEDALEYSNHILDDPISDISVQESSKFLIPFPNPDPPTLFERLTKHFGDGYLYEPASTMVHLCVERLENEELTKVFDIGEGFNKRAYFLTLHVWLLYRRVEREIPEGVLLNRYLLKIFYKLIKDWLGLRQTPEFRFRAEFENTQNHMVKFIAELQKCTEDGYLYPYKMSVCFKKVMYEDDVSDEVVDLLVKYTIRQFMHLHNIDTHHLMNAMFLWGDTEEFCKPARLLKRPMMQLIKYGAPKGWLGCTAHPGGVRGRQRKKRKTSKLEKPLHPTKNSRDNTESSWTRISYHADKNRYYKLILAKRPRRYELLSPKHLPTMAPHGGRVSLYLPHEPLIN